MASNNSISPRQKMINLIYIVLLAMLAINVSSDVMSGYSVLNNGYASELEQLKNNNLTLKNKIYGLDNDSITAMVENIDVQSLSALELMDSVKVLIAKEADGEDYVAGELKDKENMKVVPYIMLAPTEAYGKKVRKTIEDLRNSLTDAVTVQGDRDIISRYLNTEPVKNAIGTSFSWERECFTTLPAEGGIVLLNKLEISVLHAVNRAYMSILESMNVKYDRMAMKAERKAVAGVAPAGMNILYAGVDNEMSVFASDTVRLAADKGKVYHKGGRWYVKPELDARSLTLRLVDSKTGAECGSFDFRVVPVKSPTAYLSYRDAGNARRQYFGGTPVSKDVIVKAAALSLQKDELAPDIDFRVLEFEMVFVRKDKSIHSLTSKNERFTKEQLEYISGLENGDMFYITSIRVRGNDGVNRQISPIEVIIKNN